MSASVVTEGIPVEELQGEWVASRGEVVVVRGSQLCINGKTMTNGLKLSNDGTHVVGFGIYKVAPRQEKSGELVWLAGYQEIIWRRSVVGEAQARIDHMNAHMDDTAVSCGVYASSISNEQETVRRLNELIAHWREGPLIRVRSDEICPDWTNRAETGLSVDHVHYIANLITENGFKSRRRGFSTRDGAHDVPVLVRATAESALGRGALKKWQEAVSAEPNFPPFLLDGKSEFFSSLGNGHFSQALNLFRTSSQNLWTGKRYTIGNDEALREALYDGVESVVLSSDMPRSDRQFVSEMLNRAHGRQWYVEDDGQIRLEEEPAAAVGSLFVNLSKVLDAEELSCLVRQKLRVDVDRASTIKSPVSETHRPSLTAVAAAAAGDGGFVLPRSRL